ncbi:hypothetical protein PWYN_09330 [Paenibacillus wynnii]|uniref:Uncharacterized protein n=2 Tax=Paenibacillus wynnii TaxID=268407 RepID=A0A098MAE7_9BACL|nr:hypothetical protein PWYN_09330 [Paenibacillus wynnii]
MIITITGRGLRKDEILFTSPYGEGKGIWCGAAISLGHNYEVEFEINQLLMRWIDILPAAAAEYSLTLDKDQVTFTGRLENIEEDGSAFLQMGDSLIMFECLGEPMALGTFVEVKTADLRIYDMIVVDSEVKP